MKSPVLVVLFILFAVEAFAQTESARISGRVTDLTRAVIVGAQCTITNIETEVSTTASTNDDGIYVVPDLRPAVYRLTIQKDGFRTVVQPSLQLYVQDAINENFTARDRSGVRKRNGSGRHSWDTNRLRRS
jgi:Carboxypeptidase regulatory-like domain